MTESNLDTIERASPTGLDQSAMDYLRAGAQETSYPNGAAIVTAGEPGRAFDVVTAGEADVVLADGNGRRPHLARLSVGNTFGEMSLQTALTECEPLSRGRRAEERR